MAVGGIRLNKGKITVIIYGCGMAAGWDKVE
jgi:hypothetical protein